MVFKSELGTLEPIHFADGIVSDSVLEASKQCDAVWLPVQADLVTALLELANRPGVCLVRAGETGDEFSRPLYIARAAHQGNYYFGLCAFHLSGARISVGNLELVAPRYDVLVGANEEFRWFPVKRSARIEEDIPAGQPLILYRPSAGSSPVFVRYRSQQWLICGTIVNGEAFQPISGESNGEIEFKDVDEYEVFIHSKSTDNHAFISGDPEDRVKIIIGRFCPDNHWEHVKQGDRYSTAVTFAQPLRSVPQVIVGFDYLDISHDGTALRLRLYPQNITKESFICNMESWNDTKLFNGGATWAIINEPGWQTGVLKTKPTSDGALFDNRVTFSTPFTAPPMVFVCFSGLDLTGRWDLRVEASSVSHLGFSISFLKPGAKVGVAPISWIAIPGDDILKRKNVWIGRFSTEMGKRVSGKDGEWSGHTAFGFDFKRTPKVFVGVDQLSFDNEKTLRLLLSTSKVSQTGMDWSIKKFGDSIIRGAGASFLALDCA